MFFQLGGNKSCQLEFNNPKAVYFISSYKNMISCSNITFGSEHMKYKLYTLDGFYKLYPFKVGERVKSAHGDWYTHIIEMKEIDGEVKYRTSGSGVNYFQSANNFVKCSEEPISKDDFKKTIEVLTKLQILHAIENNYLSVGVYTDIIMDIKRQMSKYYESK